MVGNVVPERCPRITDPAAPHRSRKRSATREDSWYEFAFAQPLWMGIISWNVIADTNLRDRKYAYEECRQWTLHRFRRTCRTMMRLVVEVPLPHPSGGKHWTSIPWCNPRFSFSKGPWTCERSKVVFLSSHQRPKMPKPATIRGTVFCCITRSISMLGPPQFDLHRRSSELHGVCAFR